MYHSYILSRVTNQKIMKTARWVAVCLAIIVVVLVMFILSLFMQTITSIWIYDERFLTCVDIDIPSTNPKGAKSVFGHNLRTFKTSAGCLSHMWHFNGDDCVIGARNDDVSFPSWQQCQHPPLEIASAYYVPNGASETGVCTKDLNGESSSGVISFQSMKACCTGRFVKRGDQGCLPATPNDEGVILFPNRFCQ